MYVRRCPLRGLLNIQSVNIEKETKGLTSHWKVLQEVAKEVKVKIETEVLNKG